jgi:hypothetical protein
MPDRTAIPEELLDQWLDALNDGEASPAPAAIADLADVALDYRRALARGDARPERNGKMHHSLTIASPNGTPWRIAAQPRRQKVTWSSWLATAAVVALLVGLVGGAALRTWGLSGEDDPSRVAGIAASPEASPASGALSCASPGYIPVVSGNVDPTTLAAIGLPYSIVQSGDGVTVPLPNGETRKLPLGSFPADGLETALDINRDNSATVIRISDGETWELPPVKPRPEGGWSHVFDNNRYYLGPADDSRTDWIIIDTLTGETRTTSDIIGAPFEGGLDPWPNASSEDADVFAASFGVTFGPQIGAETFDSPGVLVIPGSLDDAYFIDRQAQELALSPDGTAIVVDNLVLDSATGERVDDRGGPRSFTGELIGFLDEETLVVFGSDEVRRVDPATGEEVVIFTAGSAIQQIAWDASAGTVAVGAGSAGSLRWTLVELVGDGATPLPDLAGFNLNLLTGNPQVREVDGVAEFTQASDPGDPLGYIARALDTRTGAVSEPVEGRQRDADAGSPIYPAFATSGVMTAQDSSGDVTIVDPAGGAAVTIPPPAGVGGESDMNLWVTVAPGGGCTLLNIDVGNRRVGTTWAAPIAPGAEWTALGFFIDAWVEAPDEPQTLPAQDFATPAATPEMVALSCASPGYVPVVSGDPAADLAAFGGPDSVIRSTDEGVFVPLPSGETRELPPGSFIYPGSDLALAVNDDNSATATRISTGETWEYPPVEPRVEEQNWDFFANGRYVIGPVDDSRTDWLITDTRTGEARTTADILGEPFEGPLDLWTQSSSENGDLWLLQFMSLTFPDHDETPPAEVVDAPGYLVIPGSLDDAWFSDSPVRAEPIETVISPEGMSYMVTQTVRDPKTGERIDSGEDNLTYFGDLVGYLDESTLLTYRHDALNAVDIHTAVATPIYTAEGDINSVAWDRDAGTLAVGSGTGDESAWTLIDLATGEATPLPELDGYQLANVSMFGAVSRVNGAAAFTAPQDGGDISVRALDMHSGTLSEAVTTRTDTRASGLESRVPAWDQGRYVRTTDDAGTPVFIDAASGTTVMLPVPDSVEIPDGGQLDISVVPDGKCATLTPVNSSYEPAGNTWVAPIEPGATWTELPFAIERWVQADDLTGSDPEPARDAATVPATPDEAFTPDYQVSVDVQVSLRAEPTVQSEIVERLSPGTPVDYLGEDAPTNNPADGESWMRVATEDGRVGWIREIDLQPFESFSSARELATPESAALSCAAPGYRAVVRGEVDPADIALLGDRPIDVTSDSVTAANGTEIELESDWAVYPNSTIIISGDDFRTPDTITSLVTGESWSVPTPVEDPSGGVAIPFTFIGPWLLAPVDDTRTDWRFINTDTGEDRLTSDLFGAPFSEPRQPGVPGPWLLVDSAAAIVAFSATDGSNLVLPVLVLPSANIADAWSLGPAEADAAHNGAITADGSRVAYVPSVRNDRVVVLDGFTGERLGYYRAPDTDEMLQTVGLTVAGDKLIVRDNQQVWTVDLATGEIATVFDPGADIHGFEFDRTTGTALASAGDDFALVWIDPATGEVKDLDIALPMRFPQPQLGWALIQTLEDYDVSYALVDMATGELAAPPISAGPDQDGDSLWLVGNDETGVFVVRPDTARLLVLDGPRGRAFELAAPEEGAGGWSGIAIGVSPDASCLVYTEVGEGEASGTSWIAAQAPDAEWTELPFELAYWVEMPPAPEEAATPVADAGKPITMSESASGTGRQIVGRLVLSIDA